MASRARRFSTPAAVRITLILGANVLAGWFLWTQLDGDSASAPVVHALDSAAPAAELTARDHGRRSEIAGSTERSSTAAQARLDRLGAKVQSVVAQFKNEAETATKGRVRANAIFVSVSLRDSKSGAEFGLDAGRALRPASNMKIVTTAATLTLLGPEWEFATPIEARGTLTEGRLQGDLVLRASGDPLFDMDAEGSVRALLEPALDELERTGLRTVSGGLVLDEGGFDLPAAPEGWPPKEQRYQEYCALSGGFTANRGCLTVKVAPTSVGAAAKIQVLPEGYDSERQFSATTIASGPLTLGFDARVTGLIVRGSIPKASAPYVGACPVPDPVELFAAALRFELDRRGIRIEGPTRRERNVAAGTRLAVIRTPWTRYLMAINQESNNAVADQVYLGTAHAFRGSGDRQGASDASIAALERLNASESDFRQVDGSGLSELNRVSARQLTALLRAACTDGSSVAELYRSSLAVAGVSGTLSDRMRRSPAKGRVLGKTGFIAGTSSLSGIAMCSGGGEVIFSIVINYPDFSGLNTSVWKPMQDDICELLVGAEL